VLARYDFRYADARAAVRSVLNGQSAVLSLRR
jgi:hypothetical protein